MSLCSRMNGMMHHSGSSGAERRQRLILVHSKDGLGMPENLEENPEFDDSLQVQVEVARVLIQPSDLTLMGRVAPSAPKFDITDYGRWCVASRIIVDFAESDELSRWQVVTPFV